MAIGLLVATLAPFGDRPLGAQEAAPRHPSRGVTLAGVVVDASRAPIANVEVGILWNREIVRAVRTDSAGRFEFSDLPRAKTSLVARRLGYQPRVYTVQVREGATRAFLPVVLDPMPTELEKVIVMARLAASRGRLKEFYERKSRGGMGTFIEREEIERRHPHWMSDMLRTVPGVRVIPRRGGGNSVRIRGCVPTVWLDGLAVRGAQLDEIVRPNDVAAVEVYRSSAGLPPQFASMNSCGAIVVWTRIE
jgi:hypothetical protein